MKNKIYTCDRDSPFLKTNSNAKINIDNLDECLRIHKSSQKESYFKNFIDQKYKKSTSVNSFIKTVENVEKNIPNCKNINNKLLVVGNIQSGKTDFMLGLTAKLFDRPNNTFNILFVLSTCNTSLLNQTNNRFNSFFGNFGIFKILKYEDLKNESNIEYKNIEKNIQNKKIIIFLLKQEDHLIAGQKLLNKLMDNTLIGNVAIFDDEGDSASFDNIQNDEQSTINRNLEELILKTKFFGSSFISITATPFAHIMVDNENNMKPDKVFILEPGDGYIGLEYYSEKSLEENSKIIKGIEIDDITDFSFSLNEDANKSIVHFMIQSFIFPKVNKNKKPRMMINIYREKENHFKTKDEINELIESYKNNPILLENILKELIVDYDEWLENYGSNSFCEKLSSLIIETIIPLINIKVLNSDDSADDVELDKSNYSTFEIVIGSDKLGRGLTFIDLTTVFVLRRSKVQSNADTVLQLARWFGYREKYSEMMKIFLSNDLIDDFNMINYATKEIIPLLKQFEQNDTSLKEMDKIFPTETMKYDFGVTRKSVVETYWQSGPKYSYMNNKLEKLSIDSKINTINNKFLDFFKGKFKNNFDEFNYPNIFFNSFKELNEDLFLGQKKEQINENYHLLFGIPTDKYWSSNRNLIDNILDEENLSKIIIRFIGSKKDGIEYDFNKVEKKQRILNFSENEKSYFSFGQGNYGGENAPLQNPSNSTLYIDILPIKVWTREKIVLDNSNIIRSRIFLPNSLLKNKTGLITK